MFTNILCPIDGSRASVQALNVAAELAREQQASLTICNVVDPSRAAAMAFGQPTMTTACYDALEDESKALLSDTASRCTAVPAKTALLNGPTIAAIVEYAGANACDLIVMGSHGRSGIQRALLGSVAEGVLRHAEVPVMVIRWNQGDTNRQATDATQAATA